MQQLIYGIADKALKCLLFKECHPSLEKLTKIAKTEVQIRASAATTCHTAVSGCSKPLEPTSLDTFKLDTVCIVYSRP